ncbi:restriction endonuclease subunit S [Streptococcus caballi]|uniref:restriction endonuclease subunit S n=1 Tax=Streptococcus caballi TaxID=439220 RepID=UPI0003623E1F|nr:restriction endonuclease subunit S [Streptococcus caballi]
MTDILNEYKLNQIKKVKLGDIAEIFKGKALPAKTKSGEFALINLRDMTEIGVDYSQLQTFSADRKTLLHFLLQEGDVLIASKGTVKKVAVFEKQDRDVVASSNITILRPTQKVYGQYIKLFLDSAVGEALLESVNKGKSVMNLSTQGILGIEIPDIPTVKQAYLINRYQQGLSDYKRKIARAKQEWQKIQADIERNLF